MSDERSMDPRSIRIDLHIGEFGMDEYGNSEDKIERSETVLVTPYVDYGKSSGMICGAIGSALKQMDRDRDWGRLNAHFDMRVEKEVERRLKGAT